jgi:hypothetical protein
MGHEPAIVLHLGAHKTASTHLQLGLKRARAGLAARIFVPDDLRKEGLRLQDRLAPGADDPAHEAALRAAFAGSGRLVISEENILGQVPGAELAADPRLYPGAGDRLVRLARLLPPGPVRLALAVREGAGFVAACHSQALMAGRVAPFGAMFGALDPAALDWDDLAGRLLAALPGAELVVWDHADWPAVAPQVAAALLGAGAPALPLPPGLAHPGLSAPAVARLLAEGVQGPAAAARARALRLELPKDAGHPGYEPLGHEARARAAAAHARALDRLARRPGVTLLRPGPG